jgi:hypothetical protein
MLILLHVTAIRRLHAMAEEELNATGRRKKSKGEKEYMK